MIRQNNPWNTGTWSEEDDLFAELDQQHGSSLQTNRGITAESQEEDVFADLDRQAEIGFGERLFERTRGGLEQQFGGILSSAARSAQEPKSFMDRVQKEFSETLLRDPTSLSDWGRSLSETAKLVPDLLATPVEEAVQGALEMAPDGAIDMLEDIGQAEHAKGVARQEEVGNYKAQPPEGFEESPLSSSLLHPIQSVQYFGGPALESLGANMLPSMAAGFVTRGRFKPDATLGKKLRDAGFKVNENRIGQYTTLGVMGAGVFGQEYEKVYQETGSHEEAMDQATVRMFNEVVPEIIPMGQVFKTTAPIFMKKAIDAAGGITKVAAQIANGAMSEGLSEVVTEAFNMFYDTMKLGKEVPDREEAWKQFVEAFMVGALMGAGMTVPGAVGEAVLAPDQMTEMNPLLEEWRKEHPDNTGMGVHLYDGPVDLNAPGERPWRVDAEGTVYEDLDLDQIGYDPNAPTFGDETNRGFGGPGLDQGPDGSSVTLPPEPPAPDPDVEPEAPTPETNAYLNKAREIFEQHGVNRRIAEGVEAALLQSGDTEGAKTLMDEYDRLVDDAVATRLAEQEEIDLTGQGPTATDLIPSTEGELTDDDYLKMLDEIQEEGDEVDPFAPENLTPLPDDEREALLGDDTEVVPVEEETPPDADLSAIKDTAELETYLDDFFKEDIEELARKRYQTPEQIEKAKKIRADKLANNEEVNATAAQDENEGTDTLLKTIAKRGGLNWDAWQKHGFEDAKSDNGINQAVVGRPLFSNYKGSFTPDGLAEHFNQSEDLSWVPDQYLENGLLTANSVLELVQDAISNPADFGLSPYHEAQALEEYIERGRDEIRRSWEALQPKDEEAGDLLGDDTEAEQALADEERRKTEERDGKKDEETVDVTEGDGELFNGELEDDLFPGSTLEGETTKEIEDEEVRIPREEDGTGREQEQDGGEQLSGEEGQQPQDGASDQTEGSGTEELDLPEGNTAEWITQSLDNDVRPYLSEEGKADIDAAIMQVEEGDYAAAADTIIESVMLPELVTGDKGARDALHTAFEEIKVKRDQAEETPPPEVSKPEAPALELEAEETTKEPKKPKKRKLKDEGLDIRRWWDGMKSDVSKAEADATKVLNQILARTSRPRVFNPVPAEGATPGVQRYYDELRGTFMTFLNLSVAFANAGPWESQKSYLIKKLEIEDKRNEILDYAREYEQMMNQMATFLSGASTIEEVEEKLAQYIDTTKFHSVGAYYLDFTLNEGVGVAEPPHVLVGDQYYYPWHNDNNVNLLNLLHGRKEPTNYRKPGPRVNLKKMIEQQEKVLENTKTKRMVRPKFKEFFRDNEKSVRDGDVTIAQFQKEFGFSPGKMMGEWVKAGEDQKHLNAAWDAFADLADILGLPRRAMGFFGNMYFLVGKVGAGRHAAHFTKGHQTESGPVDLINVTKTSGDGSVAHEWGHAIDLKYLRDQQKAAFDMIQDHMHKKYDIEEFIKVAERALMGHQWMTHHAYNGPKGSVQNATALLEWWRRKRMPDTQYKVEADLLGKGNNYWNNDKEMFARAFESYIFDKMQEAQTSNNYLVTSWVADGGVSKDAGYRGNPYPEGEERQLFNALFDAMFKALTATDTGFKFDQAAFEAAIPEQVKNFDKAFDELIESLPERKQKVTERMAEEEAARVKRWADRKREREEQAENERLEELKRLKEKADAAKRLQAEEEARKAEENPPPDRELTDDEYLDMINEVVQGVDEDRSEKPDEPLINPPPAEETEAEEQEKVKELPPAVQKNEDADRMIEAAAEAGVTGVEDMLRKLAEMGNKPKRQGSTRKSDGTTPKPRGPRTQGSEKPKLPKGVNATEYAQYKELFTSLLDAYRQQGATLKDLLNTIYRAQGKNIIPYLKHWLLTERPTENLTVKEGNNDPRETLDTEGDTGTTATGDVGLDAGSQDAGGMETEAGGATDAPGGRDGRGGRTGDGTADAGGTNTGQQPTDAGQASTDTTGDGDSVPVRPGPGQGVPPQEADGRGGQSATESGAGTQPTTTSTGHDESGLGSQNQLDYIPGSDGTNEKVLIPSNMREAVIAFFNMFKGRHGKIEKFVQDKLGYKDLHNKQKTGLLDVMFALQVDALAAGISAIEDRQQGIIIADQTGLGKGRQAAGMIRYALRHGYTPVFVTAKANLFTDMWDDLREIDEHGVTPFIFNGEGGFVTEKTELDNGTVIATDRFKLSPAKRKAGYDKIQKGIMPEGYNTLFLTYSQVQATNARPRAVLQGMVDNGMKPLFIFDESHEGAGERSEKMKDGSVKIKGAGFMFNLIKDQPVMYLSATWAKRPDNMLFYYRTDLINAVNGDVEKLEEAMKRGGEALQGVAASMLSKAGQLWRRERSFADITFGTEIFSKYREKHEDIADRITEELRNIILVDEPAQEHFKSDYERDSLLSYMKGQDSEGILQGVADKDIAIYHHPFNAVVHNYISQFMASLKVDDIVDEAVKLHEAGEKVVVAFEKTMSAFMEEQIADGNAKLDQQWNGDYREIFRGALRKTLKVSFNQKRTDNKVRVDIPLDMMPEDFQTAYNIAMERIEAMDVTGLETFYIDRIKDRLQRAGMNVGEITGRSIEMTYDEKGQGTIKRRKNASKKFRRKIIDDFNSGKVDAIILNAAGSTGLSIHASEKFSDQKVRNLIVAQPFGNINTLMQVFGRVNRTGQVVPPRIMMMGLDLPAEWRPLALVQTKMKSLSANTSANTESETKLSGVVDMFNRYGNDVVAEFLSSPHETDFANLTRMSASGRAEDPDFARKFTSKLGLLPVADQEYAWDILIRNYNQLIKMLDSQGQNELKTQVKEFDAKIIANKVLYAGTEADSVFSGDAILHRVSVKLEGRQPTGADVISEAIENLDGKTSYNHANEIYNRLQKSDDYIEKRKEELAKLNAIPYNDRKAADRNRIDSLNEMINNRAQYAQEIHQGITDFRIGKTFKLKIGLEEMVGAVVNITNDYKEGDKGDPLAPFRTIVHFKVNNAGADIQIPLSRLKNSDMVKETIHVNGLEQTGEIFDNTHSSDAREVRHVVTGNLIAGFSEVPGTIISFQAANGKFYQGILLPKSYDAGTMASGLFFRSGKEIADYLKATIGRPMPESLGVEYPVDDGQGKLHPVTLMYSETQQGFVWTWPTAQTAAARNLNTILMGLDAPDGGGSLLSWMHRKGMPAPDHYLDSNTVVVPNHLLEDLTNGLMPKFKGTFVSSPAAVTLAERVLGRESYATSYTFDGVEEDMSLKAEEQDQADDSPEISAPIFMRMTGLNLGFGKPTRKDKSKGAPTINSRRIEDALREHEGYSLPEGSVKQVPIPNSMKPMAKVIKSLFNRQVIFLKLPENAGVTFSGVVLPNDSKRIYVNIDTQVPFRAVVGHELLHTLRLEYPDLYEKLGTYAQRYAINGSIEAYRKVLIEQGESPIKTGQDGAVYEEMMANVIGEVMNDSAFMRSLAMNDGSFLRRLMDALVELFDKILTKMKRRGMANSVYFHDIYDLKSDMRTIIREFVNGEGDYGPSQSGEVGAPIYHPGEVQPAFYSALFKTVSDPGSGMPKRGTPADYKNWLNGMQNKGRFTKEERDWSGVDEWLDETGAVTRPEVIKFIESGLFEIGEIELGKDAQAAEQQKLNDLMFARNELYVKHYRKYTRSELTLSDMYSHRKVPKEVRKEFRDMREAIDKQTKKVADARGTFDAWTLDGGDGYKEIIFTAPYEPKNVVDEVDGTFKIKLPDGTYLRDDEYGMLSDFVNVPRQEAKDREFKTREEAEHYVLQHDEDVYTGGHYKTIAPNVFAHVRIKTHTDVDGKRVLLIEEIQSDLHQSGRKSGYRNPNAVLTEEDIEIVPVEPTPEGVRQIYQGSPDGVLAHARKYRESANIPQDAPIIGYKPRNREGTTYSIAFDPSWNAERVIAQTEKSLEENSGSGAFDDTFTSMLRERRNLYGEPDAPFKKTWPMFVFKNMIRYAAENGYERIGWTTGVQQNERYSLEKHIDKVVFERSSLGAYAPADEGTGTFMAWDKDGEEVMSEYGIHPDQISEYIGEELAEKLMQQTPHKVSGMGGTGALRRSLSGVDLKTGGEGMIGFYDRTLPRMVNKYVKKWGAKASTTNLDGGGKMKDADLIHRYDNDLMPEGWKIYYNKDGHGYSIMDEHYEEMLTPERFVTSLHALNYLNQKWVIVHDRFQHMLVDKLFDTKKEATEYLNSNPVKMEYPTDVVPATGKGASATVHSIDVTPQMRKSALEGQPLFMRNVQNQLKQHPLNQSYKARANKIIDMIDDKTRWYHALGDLPLRDAYLKRRYLALGQIGDAEALSREINAGFKKASNLDKQRIYDYLTTRGADPMMIKDPDVRAFAVALKKRIDLVGKKLVSLNMITEETYETYRDAYLPRMYLKYLLDEDAWKALGAGKRASTMGYLKKRKDVDPDVRALILGEVKDPAFLSSVAITRSIRDIAILDFLDEVASNGAWVHPNEKVEWGNNKVSLFWLRNESARLRKMARVMENREDAAKTVLIAEEMEALADEYTITGDAADLHNYKQVPKSAQFGRLAGLWVRKEIHNDLTGVSGYGRSQTTAESLLGYGGIGTKVNQWWKVSKVAMNPPTQIRNFISNMILLNLSGVPMHNIAQKFAPAFMTILAEEYPELADKLGVRKSSDKNLVRAWEIAKKYGVTQSTFSNIELARVHRALTEIRKEHAATPLKRGRYEVQAVIELVADKAGDIYQIMESIGKTIKIAHEIKNGMEEGDAALEAHKWLFDYSLVPRTVGYLRNTPFGVPFITFYYKVAPRMIESAIKNPVKIAAYLAMPVAYQLLMAALHDVDDDDMEALRKSYPEWIRDHRHVYLLPWKDEHGRWQVFDFSYFLPWTMFTDIGGNVATGEFNEALKATGVFGGPISNLIVATTTGIDPYTQRPIINEYDPPKRQFVDIVNYLWSLAAPSIITDKGTLGKVMDSMGYTEQSYDDKMRPRSTMSQALIRAFGINLYSIDPELSRIENMEQMKYEIQAMKRRMKRELSKPHIMNNKEKFDRMMLEYMTRIEQRIEQMARYEQESRIHPNLRVKDASE